MIEGTVPVPPALKSDDAVVSVQVVSHPGSRSGMGETPLSVQVF